MRTRHFTLSVAALVSLTCGAAACSSSSKSTPTTTTVAAATTTSAADAPAVTVATPAGSGGTGTTGIDACGQTTPDNVASTFVSSIAFAGPDTYDQCFVGNAVTPDQIQEISAKKFSSIQVVPDASNNTYTFTAPDGTKMVVALAKQSNGKFYVSSVTFP